MMNARIYGSVLAMLLVVTLLVVGSTRAGRAQEETTPTSPTQSQTQSQSPPVSVARPSIVPKVDQQPPSREAEADAAPPRHRHANRRHDRRYAAFWTPFPIYLPHLYRHRIVWTRLPWISF